MLHEGDFELDVVVYYCGNQSSCAGLTWSRSDRNRTSRAAAFSSGSHRLYATADQQASAIRFITSAITSGVCLSVCLCVCLFALCRSQFKTDLHQTSHTGRYPSGAELISFGVK